MRKGEKKRKSLHSQAQRYWVDAKKCNTPLHSKKRYITLEQARKRQTETEAENSDRVKTAPKIKQL